MMLQGRLLSRRANVCPQDVRIPSKRHAEAIGDVAAIVKHVNAIIAIE
jgi:hypothetical protein